MVLKIIEILFGHVQNAMGEYNMSDKWKTYPCRDCIIKNNCTTQCFRFPYHSTVKDHVNEKGLEHICLSCKSIVHTLLPWNAIIIYSCSNCRWSVGSYEGE